MIAPDGSSMARAYRLSPILFLTTILCFVFPVAAQDEGAVASVENALGREILAEGLTLEQVQAFTESHVPRMPQVETVAQWEQQANRMRQDTLDRVVFRGEAQKWREQETRVEWLSEIEGGPGYKIRKLRFEAVPGLWVPALLYEPLDLKGKVPVGLNVNGHDGTGKAAEYKQIRCINQAKRGMLALNVEWLGMGQLRGDGLLHYRMNQLDLCGTSGLAPFYLSLKRSLDVLLSHPNADPERVLVAGLSGGGWQTIFISSLDERVTLSNPVAGYSSFQTRARHLSDLGDSEQTPSDLATVTDYAHLTAMLAPRPALLTFNAKDNCCFASGHAMPPLLEAARPIYDLYNRRSHLQFHVNEDPGTHNFEIDNRQALYRMIGQHFFPDREDFSADEIDSAAEVKTSNELDVELPEQNATFNSLARQVLKNIDRDPQIPDDDAQLAKWQQQRRETLREVVHAPSYEVTAQQQGEAKLDGGTAIYWQLNFADTWSVPAVELVPEDSRSRPASIVIADGGRAAAATQAKELFSQGHRVFAVDPFYFGESKIPQRDFLFALLIAAVGERPLGIQAGQIEAAARWVHQRSDQPVQLVAVGPRTSTIALAAAALEPEAVGSVSLYESWGSLERLIEDNRPVTFAPELFCFGLLREFDLPQFVQLTAPRPVVFHNSSEGVRQHMSSMKDFYNRLGRDFDPLAAKSVPEKSAQ